MLKEKVYNQDKIERLIITYLKDKDCTVTKGQAKLLIDVLWDVIYDALVEGYIIKLHGKGQFYLSKRSERVGRNPLTGVEYNIPEREVMAYRVSDALSKRLQKERHNRIHP